MGRREKLGIISQKLKRLRGKGENLSVESEVYGNALAIDGTRVLVGYRLWCQPKDGSRRRKVKDFNHYPTEAEIEEAVQEFGMEGTYMLQEIWVEKGIAGDKNIQQFGKIVWKQMYEYRDVEDEGEEEEDVVDEIDYTRRRSRRRRKSDLEVLTEFVDKLDEISEKLDKLGNIGVKLARFGGKNIVELPEGKTMEDYVIDMMEKLKEKKEKLDKVLGESKVRDKEAELPIEGKVPAMMVYAPKMLEQMLDITERKLKRMGLLGEDYGSVSRKEVPEFPKLPR